MKSVAEQVKGLRIKLGLSQSEFGALCGGVTKNAVSLWERGGVMSLESRMALYTNKGVWIEGDGINKPTLNVSGQIDQCDVELLANLASLPLEDADVWRAKIRADVARRRREQGEKIPHTPPK
jgi:transcriptional regulator with XRE-family HTH domain